ncbi:substrate-binding domain-containing protein [Luedemannella flava]
MRRITFAPVLVAVVALFAMVLGVIIGRVTTGGPTGPGTGPPGGVAGTRIDVIIKASDSSFWQSMLAGAKQAAADYGADVSLFGPTSESDVAQQVQLVENAISRGVDGIVLAPNSSSALNNVIKRAVAAGIVVIAVDTAVTTETDGFIGTDNTKAAEEAGRHLCALITDKGNADGPVLIESSVAGVQVLQDRDAGFRTGLAQMCPHARIVGPRYNNNDINTAASQVNDVLAAQPNLAGIFAANNTSGWGPRGPSRTTAPPSGFRWCRSTRIRSR